MKALGYTFAILGTIAFISLFFGYEHQILMVAVCGLMSHALLTESKKEKGKGGF